jgi:hypothetical protein
MSGYPFFPNIFLDFRSSHAIQVLELAIPDPLRAHPLQHALLKTLVCEESCLQTRQVKMAD